jgi:hypothetical protein
MVMARFFAEVLVDAFALGEVLGDAFIGVVADALIKANRLLRHHAQPVLQAGQRHAILGVHMHRTIHVRARAQDAAMQREARPVDAGLFVQVLVHVHLHQIGRGHLGVEQLVPLHEEVTRLARHPHGGVVVDHVVPAVMGEQPIDGGEIDARLPFRRCNSIL